MQWGSRFVCSSISVTLHVRIVTVFKFICEAELGIWIELFHVGFNCQCLSLTQCKILQLVASIQSINYSIENLITPARRGLPGQLGNSNYKPINLFKLLIRFS